MTDSDKGRGKMSGDRKRAKFGEENRMKVLFAAIPAMAITAVLFVFCVIQTAENGVVSHSGRTAVWAENTASESAESSESTTSVMQSETPQQSESAPQEPSAGEYYYEIPETERTESDITRLHDEIEESIINAMDSGIVTDANGNVIDTQPPPTDN